MGDDEEGDEERGEEEGRWFLVWVTHWRLTIQREVGVTMESVEQEDLSRQDITTDTEQCHDSCQYEEVLQL